MIARIIELPPEKSFFLFGPRQTGKSTLLSHTYGDKTWSIDLLFSDLFLKYSKRPEIFRLEAMEKIRRGTETIIIDEVQRVPALLNEVHYLIENHPCRFALSGSSARKLKRERANLLAGRAVQRYLFPFTYKEVSSSFDMEEALRFGTLPAVYMAKADEKVDILKTYTETYLREEIQMEGLVRNIGGFSRFLDIAASQFGEMVNFSAVSRECHVPVRTVQSYYEILEDTLIGFRLPPWMRSARRRLVAHPRFYFFDTGVVNSINRRLTSPPDPMLKGRLFEHFIVLETYRLLKYAGSETALYFWRTNHGAEVDLVLEKNGKLVAAFEIKSTAEVTGAHLSGLRSFREEHPETPLHVVANVSDAYRIGETLVLPWREYLEDVTQYF